MRTEVATDSRPTVIPARVWRAVQAAATVGRKVRELREQLIRCESGTDSIVWMREEKHVRKAVFTAFSDMR